MHPDPAPWTVLWYVSVGCGGWRPAFSHVSGAHPGMGVRHAHLFTKPSKTLRRFIWEDDLCGVLNLGLWCIQSLLNIRRSLWAGVISGYLFLLFPVGYVAISASYIIELQRPPNWSNPNVHATSQLVFIFLLHYATREEHVSRFHSAWSICSMEKWDLNMGIRENAHKCLERSIWCPTSRFLWNMTRSKKMYSMAYKPYYN